MAQHTSLLCKCTLVQCVQSLLPLHLDCPHLQPTLSSTLLHQCIHVLLLQPQGLLPGEPVVHFQFQEASLCACGEHRAEIRRTYACGVHRTGHAGRTCCEHGSRGRIRASNPKGACNLPPYPSPRESQCNPSKNELIAMLPILPVSTSVCMTSVLTSRTRDMLDTTSMPFS